MLNFDDTDISDLKSKTHITTRLGGRYLPQWTRVYQGKSPKSSRSKRTIVWSLNHQEAIELKENRPESKVRVDRTTFGGSNTVLTVEDDDKWRHDYNQALKNARAVRNSYKKRVKARNRPQLSPIKKAPLPMDYDQRAVRKNEITRQATIETLEQVGFLWEESEDSEATETKPYADAPKRRARTRLSLVQCFNRCNNENT